MAAYPRCPEGRDTEQYCPSLRREYVGHISCQWHHQSESHLRGAAACHSSGWPSGRIHVVRRGENLYGIASVYGMNAWAIARANSILNLNRIFVGQRLTIPGPAPAVAPRSQPSSLPGTWPGPWTGEYFDNATLSGSPYTTRSDESVNFNRGYGPAAGGMPSNYFSVRWTGTLGFDEGTYRFYARVDDGVRVCVDDECIINGWRAGSLRTYTADRALTSGDHTIKVEYYDWIQVARAHFWTRKLSGPTPAGTPTPTPACTPTPTPACDGTVEPPSEGWDGEFFNNKTVEGDPVATHHVGAIGFDWGTDGAMPGVWRDGFSARWTTRMRLQTDHYRFCAMSDDGARIWVNDTLVLDEWHANNGVAYCGDYWAETGDYDVKVEYYEDGGDALIYVWREPH